ncbi:HIT family protein [Saccharopolyspora rhizosphaerae]|uniref:HIT family protein n=1 Tax=Saccharopolyspora rhizosphaerae TaxID=2492662 RepID=A0A3R8QGV3_9PSEU|nr:HIT family protein [Saccharopolyspora rhizosphaerae]RRO20720.1 HIT family protein [Saccharopolyspora rhizosphaerae]
MSDQCVFCGIVAGDVPSTRVAEDETTYAFMDINPASDGHLLVVPKRHSTDLVDIPAEDLSAVTLTAQRVARAAVHELGAGGVNLLNCCGATAWQSVFHFHLHVIPRYRDEAKDRLRLPWTPEVRGDDGTITELGKRICTALEG